MTPPNRNNRKHGFSLVEVTLALGVFSVAIIPVMGLLGSGLSVNKASIDAMVQTNILRHVQSAVREGGEGPFYFAYDGSPVAAASESLFTVRSTVAEPADAAAGLASREVVTLEIVRTDAPNALPVGSSFILRSLDPAELWGS